MEDMDGQSVRVRVFRGNDEDQFEAYIHFFDNEGHMLTTKHLCTQKSESHPEYTEDSQILDLDAFYFYEWSNVGRVECHSDIKEICLSPKLRPKIGTIEFLDERKKDLVKRGKTSYVDEDENITQYDISQFFSMMEWAKPPVPIRDVRFNLFDTTQFPVEIESTFGEKTFTSSVRFFDNLGNQLDVSPYLTEREVDGEHLYEIWRTIDLAAFLKKMWLKVSVIECRSDLSSLDRFRYVKGNIDYLIYCKANNYKKLPEYLYKRVQTRKLELFLKDVKTGIGGPVSR